MRRPVYRIAPLALASLVLGSSCKDEAPPDSKPQRQTPPAATQPAAQPEPAEPDEATGGATGAAEPADAPALDERQRGPCKIKWSNGRQLAFRYTDEGGSISMDNDGDGKNDACATFKAEGGRPTYVRVDDGCDRSDEAILKIKHDSKSNVATATVTRGSDKQDLTLVVLPSFAGVHPGYPLPGKRNKLDLVIKDGLARSANVTTATDKKKVEFLYDAHGRIAAIHEDAGSNGTVDDRFDYEYDEVGNLLRLRASSGDRKPITAKIDYTCWR